MSSDEAMREGMVHVTTLAMKSPTYLEGNERSQNPGYLEPTVDQVLKMLCRLV